MVATPFYLFAQPGLVGMTNQNSLENRLISLGLGYLFINRVNHNLREYVHEKRKKLNIPLLSKYPENVQRRVTDAPFNSLFSAGVCAGVYGVNCALGNDNFEAETFSKVTKLGAIFGLMIGIPMGAGIDFCNDLFGKAVSRYKQFASLPYKAKKNLVMTLASGSLALSTGIFSYMPDGSRYGNEPSIPSMIMEAYSGIDLSTKSESSAIDDKKPFRIPYLLFNPGQIYP
jgi:hypothetical protein